jgi:microcystin degradation protein MlrC
MGAMHIVTRGISHETTTFAPIPTIWQSETVTRLFRKAQDVYGRWPAR